MNSSEIRNTFLKYFKENNHKIIHSSSLIPENDPTLMFANSGMVQFKNIFTGKEKRDYTRAVTAQKCVRAGGKHNDLENVGYTTRHHTFFEMLGNFSFGDYFKDTAIELSWNLLTKEYGIDKNKLTVTVFDKDDEAFNLWKKITNLSNDKIIRINTSDNFWSMGDTGPCGPCSEIFYDHGDKFLGGPPGSKDEDGDRFVEIWNLVFMEYEQINIDTRINLPKPSIDTGMGLERITALLQKTNDNYKTDIFIPLIEKSIDLLNNEEKNDSPSHKVIADHLRSASFLISDGLLPSNEGRGYVLRRIMRRGMRHAHTLGNKEPIFHKMFPTLLKEFKDAYPELERGKDLIINTLFNEEIKFKQTIDKGLKILEEEIEKTNNIFDGEVAFKLYDTYGFPLDLTEDFLKNRSIKVDINAFKTKMFDQKERARKSWKGTGDIVDEEIWFEATRNLDPTEFVGYDQIKSESIIQKIIFNNKLVDHIKEKNEATIILNQTPFYGESGGQIGDDGNISNENFEFIVNNTVKLFGNYFLHIGKVLKGNCNLNEQVTASINIRKRNLIRNNHSSTHLLHSSLREILGKHVTQKGSLVTNEKLRFDFSHNGYIEKQDITKVETLVNKIINQESIVTTQILDHNDAIKSGAMALFGEKYESEVRVISMGTRKNNIFSIELCGGTHVRNTGEIKKFKIINHFSISSGVRRIEALTNVSVDKYNDLQKLKNTEIETNTKKEINKLIELIKKLDPENKFKINSKLNLQDQLKEIKKLYNGIQQNIEILKNKEKIKIEKINNFNLIYLITNKYPNKLFKTFIDDQKIKYPKRSIICLVSLDDNKVSIIIGITKDITSLIDAREIVNIASSVVGGRGGGGRKDLAQAGGNNTINANLIYNKIKKNILNLI